MALIRSLALEPPYATGAALENTKKYTHTHAHTQLSDKDVVLYTMESHPAIKKMKCHLQQHGLSY